MGQLCSTLKVCAHLEVVGKCDGVDRLTLCLPRSKGKEGRRLLGEFSFPSAGDGAGQHRSAHRTLVAVNRVAKKDGATPVRVDILAGTSLVARREFPLADLLAGLKANKIGRCSALFFSLKVGDAAGGASGAQDQAPVAVFHSGRLLDEPRSIKNDQQEPPKAEQHASLPPQVGETNTSLPPQAGDTQLILPPYAVYTNAGTGLITEVTYCVLTPKVTLMNLGDGRRWAALQAQLRQAREDTAQAGETVASLTEEVVHRDLGEGQRWVAPQAQPSQESGHTSQDGETPEVVHRDLGDGERWVAPQAQLRHRRGEPRGRSCVVLQPSILSPSKQGKDISRDGRGLVNSLLRCAQAMAFTLVMYQVTLEWF
ncbi:hypothetical protein E2C01_066647 [Portunus trituberculatus]|uniref:Uncharacterized protein n=1 Tax=Portunus trituberculatus TaxID=210409 RepID=A0A5B7HV86_PORTR|nr:hypothetical protein [Portunus trituberculatus]